MVNTIQEKEWVGKFGEEYTQVNYRGQKELLWKTNFAKLYLDRFPDLKLIKERIYPYLADRKLVNHAFLLKKIENFR